MTEHFSRNTVSATFHCNKCGKPTAHRIDSGRKGPCLDCIARLEKLHAEVESEALKVFPDAQQDLIF